MGNQQNDAVDNFFSKFDNEEENLVDFSDPSSETKEEETKETKEVINPDETKEETSQEAETDSKDDKLTPFHEHPRWKEKLANEKKLKTVNKDLSDKFEKMQQEIEALKNKPKTDDEIAEMTPQQAAKYAREQTEKEFNLKNELSKKEEDEADRYINEALDAIKDTGFDLTKAKENEVLKYAEDYTDGNIEKAFELYQKFNDTKETGKEEEAKESAKKKAAQSNRNNRSGTGTVGGFVRGTGWNNLNLK